MRPHSAFTLVELLVIISIIAMLAGLFLPIVSDERTQELKSCVYRMEMIGEALRKYHDVHGTFPPTYTVDEEGNPLHSWRVLILPHLLHADNDFDNELLKGIRLDEPWDSGKNTEFHWKMPFFFRRHQGSSGATSYMMITGENTAAGTSMATWKRKPSEVVLLIEVSPPVRWMSPDDFSTADFSTAIYPNEKKENDSGKQRVVGRHGKELHVLFADGTVKTYKNWKLPLKELASMCRTE